MAFASDGTIGTRFDKTDTSARFALGTRVSGSGGTEWIYVQADGAITAVGYVASIDEAFQATLLSTSNDAEGDLVGVAAVAFADDEYGWLQVKGPASIQVAASCAANVSLNATSTAGQLDDDGTAASMRVEGAVLTTARGGTAGTAAGMLNDPVVDEPINHRNHHNVIERRHRSHRFDGRRVREWEPPQDRPDGFDHASGDCWRSESWRWEVAVHHAGRCGGYPFRQDESGNHPKRRKHHCRHAGRRPRVGYCIWRRRDPGWDRDI
jgi:hypothetical protein